MNYRLFFVLGLLAQAVSPMAKADVKPGVNGSLSHTDTALRLFRDDGKVVGLSQYFTSRGFVADGEPSVTYLPEYLICRADGCEYSDEVRNRFKAYEAQDFG